MQNLHMPTPPSSCFVSLLLHESQPTKLVKGPDLPDGRPLASQPWTVAWPSYLPSLEVSIGQGLHCRQAGKKTLSDRGPLTRCRIVPWSDSCRRQGRPWPKSAKQMHKYLRVTVYEIIAFYWWCNNTKLALNGLDWEVRNIHTLSRIEKVKTIEGSNQVIEDDKALLWLEFEWVQWMNEEQL